MKASAIDMHGGQRLELDLNRCDRRRLRLIQRAGGNRRDRLAIIPDEFAGE